MPLRIVEITAPADNTSRIQEIAGEHECLDCWHGAKNKDGRRSVKILTTLEAQQQLTDDLQAAMGRGKKWRIVVEPVEATIPRQEEKEEKEVGEKEEGNKQAAMIVRGTITREELYNEIEKNARMDFNFALLVILSTVVCAIGLIKSNVAVIIGAMVIAPLLGPNLALAFGAALGDRHLIAESIKSNLAGLGLTLALAFFFGLTHHIPIRGTELMDRTDVSYDSLALAFAAGAAAVLSMTTGLSSTLVGVMVAVALMPPAVALGLMLGMGEFGNAYGAGLLLAANIVSISLAAQLVFLLKGFKPRTWYMRKKSKQSVKVNITFWLVVMGLLIMLIYVHHLS